MRETDFCQQLFSYFVCFSGSPIQRSCADNLWWDILNNWCTTDDNVTCDERTPNNPGNPTTEGTTIVTDPTLPPILSVCNEITHLYNLDSGAYLKSACLVEVAANYDRSESICQENNLNLFVIENSAVQTPFYNAMTNALSSFTNGHLWINGRREDETEWFTYRQTREALYSGIDWVQTEEVDGRTSGDCLMFAQHNGPYQAMGRDCDWERWLTCEFFEEPQLNTEICWRQDAIRDESGNYLKTTCIVAQIESYWRAEQMCSHYGMKLFVVNNSTVESALFNLATEVFDPNGFVWINGRRENNEWIAYEPRRVPVYPEIDWLQTESINGPINGDCLRFTQQHGPDYRAMGDNCYDIASWFICEF